VTPGGLVNVRPVQPAHSVAVGVVTRSNPAVGSIEVRVQVGEHLEFLHDVLLTSNTNLDLLSYETSSGLWKNKSFSTLGLLTSATAASTYLTTSTAASTYAPIASPTFTGTVTIPAGASISGFASLASPVFTGVPEAPTAAATTNTTQVATTAFVQQEVPAASTTAAGKVELATDAEAVAGTSATLAVTPKSNLETSETFMLGNLDLMHTWASGTSVMTNTQVQNYKSVNNAKSTAIGHAILIGSATMQRGRSFLAPIDWSKRVIFSSRVARDEDPSSECVFRIGMGKAINAGQGDLSVRGVAVRIVGSGAMELQVHDGTNLTNVTSSFTPVANEAFDILLDSNGSGTITLFVNGSSVATSSAGPSTAGTGALYGAFMELQQTVIATTTTRYSTNIVRCKYFT
jgi:hypothetical protein